MHVAHEYNIEYALGEYKRAAVLPGACDLPLTSSFRCELESTVLPSLHGTAGGENFERNKISS